MKFKLLLTLSVVALGSGCVSTYEQISDPIIDKNENLGQFTAATSYNVRGLNYEASDRTKMRTEGESCYPLGTAKQDGRLQEAMDRAIRNGQDHGIDGDLLVNVRIKHVVRHREKVVIERSPFEQKEDKSTVQAEECWIVAGDLVRITGPKPDFQR